MDLTCRMRIQVSAEVDLFKNVVNFLNGNTFNVSGDSLGGKADVAAVVKSIAPRQEVAQPMAA